MSTPAAHTGAAAPKRAEPRMLMTLEDLHARQKIAMPEEWHPFRYEAIDPDVMMITGMVAPPLLRGKYKGRPNFRKGDRTTQRKVAFTLDEHYRFQLRWEAEHAKCANCLGHGKTVKSAHVDGSRTYRTCDRCNGSGSPPKED